MADSKKSLVIGGGFAGIAAAYWCRKQDPERAVTLLEKADTLLPWTRRKGLEAVPLGSRQGHGEAAAGDYPRGWPEAGRILDKWPGSSTFEWLESTGLELAVSAAGGYRAAVPERLAYHFKRILVEIGVEIRTGYAVESMSRQSDGNFRVWSRDGFPESGDKLLLATGGERNHGLALAREAGMEAATPVPAYVRLRLASPKLGDQLGPMSRHIRLSCPASGLCETGEAHFSSRGLEGEVLSRLACQLCEGWSQRGYRIALNVDWVPEVSPSALRGELASRSEGGRRKPVGEDPLFGITPRQWRVFLELARIEADLPWGRLKPKKLQTLVQRLKAHALKFDGMGLPSGERAWAGGVDPGCIDPETGACLRSPGLHVAGEMLDMLGMPGGRQLNLVWASGYVAGSGMALAG